MQLKKIFIGYYNINIVNPKYLKVHRKEATEMTLVETVNFIQFGIF